MRVYTMLSFFCLMLCFVGGQASDYGNKKRTLDDVIQAPEQKKIKREAKKFNFKEWNENLLTDSASSLSGFNRQQMCKKMSSVIHCLRGDALLLRIDNVNESLLDIKDPIVTKLVTDIVQRRINISSSVACLISKKRRNLFYKKIRNLSNRDELAYHDALSIIKQELHAPEIISCIEAELFAIKKDYVDKYPAVNKKLSNVIHSDSSEKPFKISFVVKNNDTNIITVIKHYMSIKPTLSLSPISDAQSRKFFNDVHELERSIICDDFVTKASLELRYEEIKQQYQALESKLSEQATAYALPPLQNLEKSIQDFEEC
ncbi:MAG: hypothetical protein Q8Q60_00780 [Candidatus Chromulinivorax sp.]|nr:hypothetical protein [Candidatus Chromulinivorax sp.]